jgi:serine/threonine protein kinase
LKFRPKILQPKLIHKIDPRGGKKVDIYRLGIVALSLAEGEIVHDVFIPKSLPQDFAGFLKHCLDKDERDRWSADQVPKKDLSIRDPHSCFALAEMDEITRVKNLY